MVGSSLGGVLRGILLVFVWIALQLPIGAVAVAQVSENSATALSAAPSAIAVGQTVTLTAAVTNLDASFLPTATVVFTDLSTGTVLGSVFQVGAPEPNTYSLNVTTLAAGNHSIQASYSGGNYVDAGGINKTVQPSDSNVVIVTVTAPPASVALSSSQNPSQVGQAVTFTATVTGLSPTGSVTFRDGATVLGTVALSGGQANLSTSALAAGSHSITAEYGGDANNAGSTSAPLNQQVNQAGSGVSLASSVNPSIVGQAVTFTATVTGASPTGSVTFRDGATVLGTVALSGGQANLSTSALAAGSHGITAEYGGDANNAGSTSAPLNQQVNQKVATTVALSSSSNPSKPREAVTFTARVTGNAPTGTVTFRDGAEVLGTVTLNGGRAIFTTSSLATGTHAMTASYSGDAGNNAGVSPVLQQVVSIPADSVKLQSLQNAATKLVAQTSGQAISGAIQGAIADGFSDDATPVVANENGMRFNFAAEPRAEQRVGGAFRALAYAKPGADNAFKAPQLRPQAKEWLPWIDVRGSFWKTDNWADLRGDQMNATAGLTRRITPDFLIGAFGGHESFDYTSQSLDGRLKGDGWTAGAYLGWRFSPGLRIEAAAARSNIDYDGVAGTASGVFSGERWLTTGALVGTYRIQEWKIEPSARVYALWEKEGAYLDSLGTLHPERSFSTGRASAGFKIGKELPWWPGLTLTPHIGVYGDYYFDNDDANTLGAGILTPSQVVNGWSARVMSGLSMATPGGARLSLDSEFGGLGGDHILGIVRGRLSVPF